jgi:hypothetical protein
VPKFGAAGAAVSNGLAFTIFFIARTEASAYIWKRFPTGKIYALITFLFVTTALIALDHSVNIYLSCSLWVTFSFCTLALYRDDFYSLKKYLKKV